MPSVARPDDQATGSASGGELQEPGAARCVSVDVPLSARFKTTDVLPASLSLAATSMNRAVLTADDISGVVTTTIRWAASRMLRLNSSSAVLMLTTT